MEITNDIPQGQRSKSGVSGVRKKKEDNLIVAAAIINKCNRTKECAGMGHK